jgi:hypothetical protein
MSRQILHICLDGAVGVGLVPIPFHRTYLPALFSFSNLESQRESGDSGKGA